MVKNTELTLVGPGKLGRDYKIDVKGDVRNYERAQHNIEEMKKAREGIMALIREEHPFNPFEMEKDQVEVEVEPNGKRIAKLQVERRYKKTPYQKVSEAMESHLQGINFHLGRGRRISGVKPKNGRIYIAPERLKNDFEILLGGRLNMTTEYNVIPDVQANLDGLVVINWSADKNLTDKTIRVFREIEYGLNVEDKFAKRYQRAAGKTGSKRKSPIPANSRKNVSAGNGNKNIVDWMRVVRTLIPVPTEDHTRTWAPELPYVAERSIPLGVKRREMPWYELSTEGMVSTKSVYNRIQELKKEGAKIAQIPYAKVKERF